MLQRVGIAQALLQHPQVMILDEPMAGLDPLGQKLMREIIAGIGQEGTTILISSHNLHEIGRLATHVGVLHQGALTVLDKNAPPGGEEVVLEVLASQEELGALFPELAGVKVAAQTVRFPLTPELYLEVMETLLQRRIVIRQLYTSGVDLESRALDYLEEGDTGDE